MDKTCVVKEPGGQFAVFAHRSNHLLPVLWNAAWGGLCTLARQPVRTMLLDENLPTTAETVRKIMLEILYVARACGYNEDQLPSKSVDAIFDLTYSQAPKFLGPDTPSNLRADFKPSLLVRRFMLCLDRMANILPRSP